jgi:hypothetical protein
MDLDPDLDLDVCAREIVALFSLATRKEAAGLTSSSPPPSPSRGPRAGGLARIVIILAIAAVVVTLRLGTRRCR